MKHMEFRHLKQCIQHSQGVNTTAATLSAPDHHFQHHILQLSMMQDLPQTDHYSSSHEQRSIIMEGFFKTWEACELPMHGGRNTAAGNMSTAGIRLQ